MSETQLDIPVVDLNDLQSPIVEEREAAANALLEGFGYYGLVYIRNHGIDMDRLEAFYEAFLDVTDRPEDEKQKLNRPDIWYQRGWTPPNTEKAVVAGGQPDFKECYFISPTEAPEDVAENYPEIYHPNIWPDDAAEFEASYMDIGGQLHAVGIELLRGCARALDLEPYRFEAAVEGGPHVTRALRYIPLTEEQVGTDIVWGEEHTDFNLLTLLPGGRFLDQNREFCEAPDDDSGLYLRTRPNEEHPRGIKLKGSTPEGCIVAQVGQQLEILTGGEFVATPHVIEAPGTPDYSRVSMAHFVHMHSHEILFPYEEFQDTESVAGYGPPVLAGTYGIKTLYDIGLAPKEALDSLGYTKYDVLGGFRAEEDAEG
jgi:isopenicillin N synthase-like dioxygenase